LHPFFDLSVERLEATINPAQSFSGACGATSNWLALALGGTISIGAGRSEPTGIRETAYPRRLLTKENPSKAGASV